MVGRLIFLLLGLEFWIMFGDICSCGKCLYSLVIIIHKIDVLPQVASHFVQKVHAGCALFLGLRRPLVAEVLRLVTSAVWGHFSIIEIL